MKKQIIFFLCCVLCIATSAKGIDVSRDSTKRKVVKQANNKASVQPQNITSDSLSGIQQKVVFHKKHRFIAALLAFPVPFGIFGLHRLYMHTKPAVPWYT